MKSGVACSLFHGAPRKYHAAWKHGLAQKIDHLGASFCAAHQFGTLSPSTIIESKLYLLVFSLVDLLTVIELSTQCVCYIARYRSTSSLLLMVIIIKSQPSSKENLPLGYSFL